MMLAALAQNTPGPQTAVETLRGNVQANSKGAATGLIRTREGNPASGVRVAAFVVPDPKEPAGGGALVSLTETDSAGHYRLENIPPGNYFIQAGLIDFPTFYPGVAAMTGATNIWITPGALVSGLDFALTRPPGIRITGRIPLTSAGTAVTVRMTGGSAALQPNIAQVRPDGSFEFLRVAPGNYTLIVNPATVAPNLPIVVNDTDIDLGLPTGPGVKVSGVVGTGPNSPHAAGQKVILGGSSAWSQLAAGTDAAGRFEFPKVPAGSYAVTTIPGPGTPLTTLVVADRDVTGLTLPATVELSGHVALSDGSILPLLSPALMISVRRSNGTTLSTAIRSEGAFRLPLPEGVYRVEFDNLPAGLMLKSLTYGSSDLTNSPLKLDGASPIVDIRVMLERR